MESESPRSNVSHPLSGGFSASEYEKKKDDIEREKEAAGITFADIADASNIVQNFIVRDLPKLSVKAANNIANGLTPGFVKRMRKTKIHIKQIDKETAQLDALYVNSSTTMDEELAKRKEDKRRHKILVDHLLATKHLKDEAKANIEDAKVKIAEDEFHEFHERRAAQLKERQDALNKKLEDEMKRQEQAAVDQRVWRISYFGEKAQEYAKESEERGKINNAAIEDENNLQRTKFEWEERNQVRIRMQVETTANYDPYDGPAQDKALYGADRKSINPNENDLYMEDFDNHEIHTLDSKPYEKYEVKRNVKDELQSKLQQQEALYQALQADTNEMKQSISRILDLQELLEKEQRQIHQEILSIEKDQLGPPRRLAMAHEIPATDLWKQRAKQTMLKLHGLKYAQEQAEVEKQNMIQQTLQIAKQIAITKQEISTNAKDLSTYNDGKGYLPMIVGKSINKLDGLELLGNPKELMNAITHKSRWIELNNAGQQAIKYHKDTTKLDQDIWIQRLKTGTKTGELESVISRIANIAERLKRSKTDNERLNIIDALQGFFASGIKLHIVNQKLVGLLPWYSYHEYKLSHNITRYLTSNIMGAITFEADDIHKKEQQNKANSNSLTMAKDYLQSTDEGNSNGITLLDGEYDGYCTGMIILPKDTLWSISVTITKQGFTEEYANPYTKDHIIIQFGPTIHSLQTIGTYYNRINPDTGSILYDVKYMFRGNSLGYKFEFHSSVRNVKQHLAICTGIYEEYAVQDIEIISDPKDLKKTRVMSSYVKMIRIEERQGKLRETRLLEELIDVENSKERYWDSMIVNSTIQRYERTFFLRILKAEILLQQQFTKMKRMKEREELREQQQVALRNQIGIQDEADDDNEDNDLFANVGAAGTATKSIMNGDNNSMGSITTPSLTDSMQGIALVNMNPIKQQKLIKSQKKYILKKRLIEQPRINLAQDLVTKRLILWDEEDNKWRNIIVLQCIVSWIENGLKAKILHEIQEVDEAQNHIGPSLILDLLVRKYFLSPLQKLNPELLLKLQEKKARNDQITGLELQLSQTLITLDNKYEKYIKKLHKQFHKYREDTLSGFHEMIPTKAEHVSESAVGRKAIKKLLPEILLDIRKGIYTLNEKKDKKEQMQQFAKERFMKQYIANTLEQLTLQLNEEEKTMKTQIIPKKFNEIQQQKQSIRNQINSEIENIKIYLRKQYQLTKQKLMEQVKFPKEIFAKVIPTSYHCEHLKTKAWGNNYASGVKCIHCGKELSLLHEEESQILGYGSGGQKELFLAMNEHRDNEATYRPKNNSDLMKIELERIRLEKENRIIEENECYFYDYEDLQVIYDFDVLHAKDLKNHGIFRQGLHWTEDELNQYMYKETIKHKIELENKGIIPIHGDLHDDYDPIGYLPNPLPTYRQNQVKHYANYRNYLYFIGRLSSYQKKIQEYKLLRFDILYEKNIYTILLEGLHKESYQLEFTIQSLEYDLDRTSQLLTIYQKMNRLWMQANLILQQAKKAKKKIEMSMCPYPYLIKCTEDEYTLMHEETKQLLKTKYLMEQKIDYYSKETIVLAKQYEDSKILYETNAKKRAILSYLMPGNYVSTKYGECFIISYRARDDMVMVRLPFGNPNAKAFIYYQEIIAIEQSKAYNEFLLMQQEDEYCQRVYRYEKIAEKKSRYAMQQEELHCRKVYEYLDITANQTTQRYKVIDNMIQESFDITETRKYHQLQSIQMKEIINKLIKERKRRKKEYIGPESNRPQSYSMYEIYQQKKLISLQLQQEYIVKRAKQIEQSIDESIQNERSQWQLQDIFKTMNDAVIYEMIYELAEEALSEGHTAKLLAERKSCIFIPQPTFMQYNTYIELTETIQTRKEFLKKQIILQYSQYQHLIHQYHHEKEYNLATMATLPSYLYPHFDDINGNDDGQLIGIGGGMNNWGIPGLGEAKQYHHHSHAKHEAESNENTSMKKAKSQYELKQEKKMKKKLLKMELQRQLTLCQEMLHEELQCKKFYYWEMKENLRERRLMKEEDEMSKFMRNEEIKLRKLAEETRLLLSVSNNNNNANGMDGMIGGQLNAALNAELQAKQSLALSYEKRRQELKELTIERRRRQEEQILMSGEDRYSQALRELDKLERQQAAFAKEYGNISDDDSDSDDDEEEEQQGGIGGQSERKSRKKSQKVTTSSSTKVVEAVKIPSWLTKLPKPFHTWNMFKQREYIAFMTVIHEKEKHIAKKQKQEEKRLTKLEKSSYIEWDRKYQILDYITALTEYHHLLLQEEYLQSQQMVIQMNENMTKLMIFARELGEKELKIQTTLLHYQSEYLQYQDDLKGSELWLQICYNRNKHRDKLKRKIVTNTLYIDTESINAFHQRFETKLLRERVYLSYFHNIVISMINRAEMIASERKLMLLQHSLTTNKVYLLNRISQMKKTLKEFQCMEYLRMRRSILNQKFFPKYRKTILNQCLQSWIRYYYWNQGHKDAYKLKYTLIKSQLDINRQFTKQLQPAAVKKDTISSSALVQHNEEEEGSDSVPRDPKNWQSNPHHEETTLMQRYSSRVIQCTSCFQYYLSQQNHSLACAYHPEPYVLSCPETCPNPGLTAICISHRMKRWNCCQLTDQSVIGCARRYHTPPVYDPIYSEIMRLINQRDADQLLNLDSTLEELRKVQWTEEVMKMKLSQLHTVENDLIEARKVAGRFKQLKFV